VIENASVFLINTGRHDRFQGLDFRYNLDVGFKYLFLKASANSLWGEAGYDFQYDIRRDEDRIVLDANGAPILDSNGNPQLLDKTLIDHSTRLFLAFKHSFNKEVTLTTGLEYLQSVVETTRYRINYDALFAAKVGGGLALGLGFTARYDHAPLPGKQQLDTASTISLIYAFSDAAAPPEEPKCPCPRPPAPAPPSPAQPPPPAAQPPPPAAEPPPPPAPTLTQPPVDPP
jgi:putative salt-induced outer membrane protein